MQQTGYLLLADISGYTEFVTQTEIDHGSEIMHSLIRAVSDETKAPFKVQEIEGDAIFASAPTAGFARGVLLVEMVESMYRGFQTALDSIRQNSTCSCRACTSTGDLDIKFIVHHGTFTARSIAGHEGISGPDVILSHRLLKNHIEEQTDCAAYAFFTDASVKALGVEAMASAMVRHQELYEHLGAVQGYVYDMASYWQQAKASRSVIVPPEGAFALFSATVPVSRTVAWEYATNPRFREQWLLADQLKISGQSKGRYGPGTVEHCLHGKEAYVLKTLDWKPMRYFTQAIMLPFGTQMPFTTTFEEEAEGTRVSQVYARAVPEKPLMQPLVWVMMLLMGPILKRELGKSMDAYCAMTREAAAREAG
jgi:hypothetical protein